MLFWLWYGFIKNEALKIWCPCNGSPNAWNVCHLHSVWRLTDLIEVANATWYMQAPILMTSALWPLAHWGFESASSHLQQTLKTLISGGWSQILPTLLAHPSHMARARLILYLMNVAITEENLPSPSPSEIPIPDEDEMQPAAFRPGSAGEMAGGTKQP